MPQTKGYYHFLILYSLHKSGYLITHRSFRFTFIQIKQLTSEISADDGFQKSFMCCAEIRNGPGSET